MIPDADIIFHPPLLFTVFAAVTVLGQPFRVHHFAARYVASVVYRKVGTYYRDSLAGILRAPDDAVLTDRRIAVDNGVVDSRARATLLDRTEFSTTPSMTHPSVMSELDIFAYSPTRCGGSE